jgi:hypothetical protein
MQRNIPTPALWDAEIIKQRTQAAIESAKYALSERDWQTAEIYVEREIADMFDRHRVCALARCRRARRCIGNAPLCWGRRQSKPAKVQDAIENAYVLIQQERVAAAREGRPARVLRPGTNTKRRNSTRHRPA